MKKLLPFVFLFIVQLSFGQNWAPINYGTKYHYEANSAGYATNTIYIEGIITGGGSPDTTFVFNDIIKTNNACDSILQLPNPDKQAYCDLCRAWLNQPQFLQRRVTKLQNGGYLFFDSLQFFIQTYAQVGQSWAFDMPFGIIAEVVSITEEVVLGELDSVKTISLTTGDSILLSKHHGIVLFPDQNTPGVYYRLIGMENPDLGEKVPNFWDFFDYEIGGVICITSDFSDNENGWSFDTYKMTFTSKDVLPERFQYGHNRIIQTTGETNMGNPYEHFQQDTGLTTVYQNGTWPGTNSYNGHRVAYYLEVAGQTTLFTYFTKIEKQNGKYVKWVGPEVNPGFDVSFLYDGNLNFIMYPACGEIFMYQKYEEGSGLAKTIQAYYPTDSLIGMAQGFVQISNYSYLSNGTLNPDFCLPHDVYVKEIKTSQLTISPNPATDRVQLAFSQPIKGDIVIYNQTGQVVLQEAITGTKQQIEVGHLPSGLYMLNVRAENHSAFEKLVISR